MVLFASRNNNKKFFIPSLDNDFGGYNAANIMIDSGCNSHLLSISDTAVLDQIRTLFPPSSFLWKLGRSKGAHSTSAVLKIWHLDKKKFQVSVLKDVKDLPHQFCFSIPFLRFHLCKDDNVYLKSVSLLIITFNSYFPLICFCYRNQSSPSYILNSKSLTYTEITMAISDVLTLSSDNTS